jgi:VIT family
MSRLRLHPESHLVSRIGWLRAAVLGANDGIISTASLIVGVAAAAATRNDVLIAGGRGTGGWRHVDVRGRVCLRQLTIRHRAGGSRTRA